MDAQANEIPPARGHNGRPVVWDRASWYGSPEEPEARAEAGRHIQVALRWLWARGLTTAEGDQAAQGIFAGSADGEPALTSDMVAEEGALFLDHFYGRWLSALPALGDAAGDDAPLDGLWADFRGQRAELDRVWEM
jgi:hypothetical protein